MKKGVWKLLKVFLLVSAGLLVSLCVFGVVLVLDWPWWVGFFLLLLLGGCLLVGIFLRKIWLRRREQNFVREIGEEDAARFEAMSAQEKSEQKELQERWKSAVETLRGSHLKKLGNPLYVLPWYMVIGESGSGKTTSLNSARLASPFTDSGRVRGVSGTRQCDWWFFEQSVVIDTAGRYAVPINEGPDRDEWQKFLNLLIRYRRREPLNGLIVTVAADRLLESDPEELERCGRTIRQRINELMRSLGIRFPVYVLVTKCDLIQGVHRFCELLTEKTLRQAMGSINHDCSPEVGSFVGRAIGTIEERLRNLRLLLLHQPESKGPDPALLLFPEEFKSLKDGLSLFMQGAFGENPYQETPLLRGIYFSSGRQAGNPHSQFLGAVGGVAEGESLPGTSKGLFLHDFFARILPKERSLLRPTRRALEWRTVTGNIGLTSWVILGIALCGMLSFSFVKNMKTIRDVSQEFAGPAAARMGTASDLSTFERFRMEIVRVEQRNRNWWIPRFWLKESLRVEAGLKERYCRQFREGFLTPFDGRLAEALSGVSGATPDEPYGQYAVHLVRRVNILKARLGHGDPAALQAQPQPSYIPFSTTSGSYAGPGAKPIFGPLYLSYLTWRSDSAEITREIAALRSWLGRLLSSREGRCQWLAVWVDTQTGLPPVTLKDFWGGSLAVANEKTVSPAFTRKGKETADSVLKELEEALENPGTTSAQKTDYARWYRTACLDAWQGFAAGFSRGAERLRGAAEWRQAAARMAGDQCPYFALLNRISLELEPVAMEGSIPAWLQQIYQYQRGRVQGMVADAGALSRASGTGKRMLISLRRNVGREAGAQQLEARLEGGKAYQQYRNALAVIVPATASRNLIFQLATQAYSEDPVAGKSPFSLAAASASRVKANAAGVGATEPLFGQLVSGPLDFLWMFARRESACQLQSLWEEQVLAGAMGMHDQQAIPYLLGPDGPAWRFVKGPAAPFLTHGVYGYRAKEALGGTVPLEGSLFSFMTKGARTQATVMSMGRQQNMNVGIRGLPTDANGEASIKPHATRLEVQCGGSSQTLVNNNYPVGKTFAWSPETCSDVVFQIEVGDVVLTRHYSGPEGFPDFLKDMRGGRRTFSVREFPGERSALERMGIKTITVNYRFIGSGSVLRQTAALSGQAPRSIARCWAQ